MWLKVKRGLKGSAEKPLEQKQSHSGQAALQVPSVSIRSSFLGSVSSEYSGIQPQPKRLRDWPSLSTFLSRRRTGPAVSRSSTVRVVCSSGTVEHEAVDSSCVAARTCESTPLAWSPHEARNVPIVNRDSRTQTRRPSSSILSPIEGRFRDLKRLKVQSLCLQQESLRRNSVASADDLAEVLSTRQSPNSLLSLDSFRISVGELRSYTPATISEVLEASRASSTLERDELHASPVKTAPSVKAEYDRYRHRSRAGSWRKTYCQGQRFNSLPAQDHDGKARSHLIDYSLHRAPPANQRITFDPYAHRRITSA